MELRSLPYGVYLAMSLYRILCGSNTVGCIHLSVLADAALDT